jgi:hypothetical protein
MTEHDYNLGQDKFPPRIELCSIRGRRLHRMPPDQTRIYGEKCGQGHDKPPVAYVRQVTPS